MKKLFEILCSFGIHLFKERLTVQMEAEKENGKKEVIDIYYNVCPHCGDGNPFITGEF